jgi:MtfA peptidase
MNIFKRAQTIYVLRRYPINRPVWDQVTRSLAIFEGLGAVERAHLRELTTLFLHQKNIWGVREFQLTEQMCVAIAAQACLPILGLGLGVLDGWSDMIVYPDVFRVFRDDMDDYGVVHSGEEILSGESWLRGPVILSWRDIESDMQGWQPGRNVVIHEIAHKLDMLNGTANGMPPLHATMQPKDWTQAFIQAYRAFRRQLADRQRVCVSPYAATSPAEFFAVFSETFFCTPAVLYTHFGEVYHQLRLYYRQDPMARLATHPSLGDESLSNG